jgi:hypothetical protein
VALSLVLLEGVFDGVAPVDSDAEGKPEGLAGSDGVEEGVLGGVFVGDVVSELVGVTEGVPVAEADDDAEGQPEEEDEAPVERLAVGLTALGVDEGVAVAVIAPVPDPEGVGVGDPLGVPEFDGVPLSLPVELGV